MYNDSNVSNNAILDSLKKALSHEEFQKSIRILSLKLITGGSKSSINFEDYLDVFQR